ncbi:MAG: hypothetical protein R3A47_04020 [Polyangiales bacterium]
MVLPQGFSTWISWIVVLAVWLWLHLWVLSGILRSNERLALKLASVLLPPVAPVVALVRKRWIAAVLWFVVAVAYIAMRRTG